MITALPKTFEEGIRSIHDDPQMALGEYYHSNDLAIHTSYVRFAEDVNVGDAVRTKFGLYSKTNISTETNGGSTYPAKGSMQITEHDATYETSLADGLTLKPALPRKPDYRDYAKIAIVGGTGAGQHGILQDYTNKILNILWYDTDGLYKTGRLTTALGSSTDYVIWAPWYVEQCDGPGITNGVSLVKAKKGQYGLIIWCGDELVKVTDAVTAGTTLYVDPADDDAGQAGIPPATVAGVRPGAFATAHHAGAADSLVQATIYAKPISIVPELPRGQVRGFARPA